MKTLRILLGVLVIAVISTGVVPAYDVNKDLINVGKDAYDLKVILSGYEVVPRNGHFDGWHYIEPRGWFESFAHGQNDKTGNTELHWQNFNDGTDNVINNGQVIHVGWTTIDHSSKVIDMYWTGKDGQKMPGSIILNITSGWTYEQASYAYLHWDNDYTVEMPIQINNVQYAVMATSVPLEELNTRNEELNSQFQPIAGGESFEVQPGEEVTLQVPENVPPGSAVVVRYQVDGPGSDARVIDFVQFIAQEHPTLLLSRDNLHYGSELNGPKTTDQTLYISNPGRDTLNWTITDNATWLSCTPSSGTNSGEVNVLVDPTGLPVGNYTGTITVEDPNASHSPQTVTVTLNVYPSGAASGPFGEFSTPIDGSTVCSSIPVTGWALDDIGVSSLKIYRDPVSGEGSGLIYIGDGVFVEGARPDVEQAYPGYPMNYKAGWGYMLLTNFFPDGGNGTFTLYAIAQDVEGNTVTLGTRTITCDNANAVKPFGAIDTPTQGGTASGSNYVNWGWVLTPPPNYMATDGSTINVWVDGVNIGHPTYNIYRADIANLFPGYANSNGAVGYFYLETTAYWGGVHTIQWTATDSAGNTDGIGSRYFTIQNIDNSESNSLSGLKSRNQKISAPGIERWENLPIDQNNPVQIRKGFRKNIESRETYHNEEGLIKIEIRELERIELDFSDGTANNSQISGYMAAGNQIYPLPIGATLDSKNHKFYWQPGPGFIGEYRFVFIEKRQNGQMQRKNIIVKIVPKFGRKGEVEK
ncbi:MAG: hypothetical protein GTO45_13880 [Candidatus Aminicenantes bacterium]|nr:hypothetical protein [Candidatus Aminicenantes bacterium]NIM79861.1 hypothetical protein [Candidatus Aminicenantes bacterium]NIN19197.1 hypothetical protein [Candidatus Aminicenantes bacterium]NIN43102.1 hypothetical protein [Candidatus Aminicenantes bacterium]NIN85839.1 hypothetical protein [Candidatus Aminicenantes bacterium]